MYQRLAAGGEYNPSSSTSSDPLDDLVMHKQRKDREHRRSPPPPAASRQNSQNGHPFAVPSEKSRTDRDVGSRRDGYEFFFYKFI